MRRLRLSFSGREKAIRFPAEEEGNASLLVDLVIDAFELPRATDVQFVNLRGKFVPHSQLGLLSRDAAADEVLFCHAKASFPRALDAGQGLVQLLGDEGEAPSSTTEIMRSLWIIPSLTAGSGPRRDGYQPIVDDDGVEASGRGGGNIPAEGGDDDNGNDNGGDEQLMLRKPIEPSADFRGKSYQNQLVKFNRILAHLVNERTVLAWFRTNLALVTLSFKYMKLAQTFEDRMYASTMLSVCGGIFVVLLPISWWSGYSRYEKCKELLDYDVAKISAYLHKMGFDLDNSVFFMLVFSSFVTLCYSSTLIIWTSERSTVTDDLGADIIPE